MQGEMAWAEGKFYHRGHREARSFYISLFISVFFVVSFLTTVGYRLFTDLSQIDSG